MTEWKSKLRLPIRDLLPGEGYENHKPLCQNGIDGELLRLSAHLPSIPECARFLAARGKILRDFRKRYRLTMGTLLCVLLAVAFYAYWGVAQMRPDPTGIDGQILQLETMRSAGVVDYLQIGRLIDRLVSYEARARELQKSMVMQAGEPGARNHLIKSEVDVLMKEFGAEVYNVPPEFLADVDRFIRRFQERDHDLMARALVAQRADMSRMRDILRRDHLPEDLAYMVLVESGFRHASESQEGAAGLWQFTEETARGYGMEVKDGVDERLDLSKSTEAASRYLRDLILDFGTGSSVMLALAAYNSGPEKVRRAVRKVKDPIRQRNFWHLYLTRTLPEETLEYVPQVIAAIIIGRNPASFGFPAHGRSSGSLID